MGAYAHVYPYAIVMLITAAAIVEIVAGGFAFVTFTVLAPRAAREAAQAEAARRSEPKPSAASLASTLSYILAGAALFVGSCIAAALTLKFGAWAVAVACT